MSNLSRDLDREWEDLRRSATRGDIIKGMRILAKVSTEFAALVGLLIVGIKAAIFFTGGLASLGIPIAWPALIMLFTRGAGEIVKFYENLNKDERWAVRAALAFLGVPPSLF